MSYITPDTVVGLLKGCPIDKEYNHTLYFTSDGAQYTYFRSLTKHKLTSYSYQRYTKDSIKVNLSVNDVIDCNYMYFRNAAFGEKVFYAFIDSVEYVNDKTCAIYYTIDVMQTWYFDYEMGECFIERQHTQTDDLWEHYIDEDLETGESVYIPNNPYTISSLEQHHTYVVICYMGSVFSVSGGSTIDYTKHFYNGSYHGCNYIAFPINENKPDISDLISNMTKLGERIIDIKLCHSWILPQSDDEYVANQNMKNKRTYIVNPLTNENGVEKYTGLFGNYKPKNNKLYTYPYNFIYATNNRGSSRTYRYEFFQFDKAYFIVEGNFGLDMYSRLMPQGYKQIGNQLDYEESLEINDYGSCNWFTKDVDEYQGANRIQNLISIIDSGLKSGTIGAYTNTISNISNGAKSVFNTNNIYGSRKGMFEWGRVELSEYKVYQKRITGKYARIIDDYFTKYGYKVNVLAVPNVRTGKIRPHFNYVKTNNSIIKPKTGKGLPSEDGKLIAQIYDKGITFWTNGDNVGDYSLDNSPT